MVDCKRWKAGMSCGYTGAYIDGIENEWLHGTYNVIYTGVEDCEDGIPC